MHRNADVRALAVLLAALGAGCDAGAASPDAGDATDGATPDPCAACPDARPACGGDECVPCEDPRASCDDVARFRQLLDRRCTDLLRSDNARTSGPQYAAECALATEPSRRRIERAVRDGRIGIDAASFAACLRMEPVQISFEILPGTGNAGPCQRMWIGRTPRGAPCDTQAECADGYCERRDWGRSRPHYEAGACGVCAPRLAEGESCDGDWDTLAVACGEGLVCEGATRTCVPATQGVVPRGGACATHVECVYGLVCAIDGTCAPPGALGGACESDVHCAEGICAEGTCRTPPIAGAPCLPGDRCGPHLVCSGEGGSCVAPPVGAMCSSDAHCAEGDVCPSVSASCSFECRPRVAIGEPCCSTAMCPSDGVCSDGVCLRARRLGESCMGTRDLCVPGTECHDGTCTRAPELGEPCARWCARGTCVEGACRSLEAGTECLYEELDLCGEGLVCVGADTCQSESAAGESCALDESACGHDTYCTTVGVCAPICYVGD